MGHATEQISFSTGRYGFFNEGAVEDFTDTVPLVVGPEFSSPIQVIQPGASDNMFVEPATSNSQGQGVLDQYARCLFSTRKDGGTGAWTGTLSFRRGGGAGEIFAPPELTDIPITNGTPAAGLFIVTDLPMSFLRDPAVGTPSIADTLRCQFTVTPASTSTVGVSYLLLMLPIIGKSSQTNPVGGRGQVAGPSIQGRR